MTKEIAKVKKNIFFLNINFVAKQVAKISLSIKCACAIFAQKQTIVLKKNLITF